MSKAEGCPLSLLSIKVLFSYPDRLALPPGISLLLVSLPGGPSVRLLEGGKASPPFLVLPEGPSLGGAVRPSCSALPTSFSVLPGLASGCLFPAAVGLAPTPTELHPSMKLGPLAAIIVLYFSTNSSSRQEGVPSVGAFSLHPNKICLPLSHSPSPRS